MPSLSSLSFERFSHLPAVLPGSPVENWRHVEGLPSLLSLASRPSWMLRPSSSTKERKVATKDPARCCQLLLLSQQFFSSPGFPRLSKATELSFRACAFSCSGHVTNFLLRSAPTLTVASRVTNDKDHWSWNLRLPSNLMLLLPRCLSITSWTSAIAAWCLFSSIIAMQWFHKIAALH